MIEGRGIPDPWLTLSRSDNLEFPCVERTHSENGNIKKNIFQYLRGESYNGNNKPCFCCEKKFLFDCPDKAQSTFQNAKDKVNSLNCPCLECHGKEKTTAGVCGQHCNCIPIFRNWILEHSDSRNCKNVKKRIPSDLSSTISSKYNADEESSTESFPPSNYLMRYCSCLQNKRKNIYFDYYNVGMPLRGRSRNQKGIFTDHNGQCDRCVKNRDVKSLLCSCLLNFKHTQRESQNKPEHTNMRSSKEVQTDGQPLMESKIIQTDKTKVLKCKTDKGKCSCGVKWGGSNVIRCESSNPIFDPRTGQSFTMCFSRPSLVCPYPHTSQYLIHHVDHKRKSKKEKRRKCEVDKALQCNLLPAYVCGDIDSPIRTKPKEVLEIKNYLTRPEKGLSSRRPTVESFDYSKYLAEKRVKKFLEEKGFFPERKFDFRRKSYGIATNLKRFEDERTKFLERRPNDKEREVFKPAFHVRNHDFELIPQDTNYDSLHEDESHDLNPSVRNSTRKNAQNENFKQDSRVKVNFLKQLESNESRTYGLVAHCKSSCSQTKKRKKVARKGRRKPLRVTYPPLERPPTSKKFPNSQQSNNVGQLDQTDNQRGEVSLKAVSFCDVENNEKASRGVQTKHLQFLSVEEESSKKNFHTFTDTRTRNDQETINRHYEWNDQIYLMESFKKPLKSELNFNNILQQISLHNSSTTWSSDTLKNIVDELLLERKTLE